MDNNRMFVLITPARNEEKYIQHTIQSVVNQELLPSKWIIVSDGSTDQTEIIVREYAARYKFIELITSQGQNRRNFGSKVNAFNCGYRQLDGLNYNYLGNLDADVSFKPDYFSRLLKKFEVYPNLGIGGGIIQELIQGRFITQNVNLNSVAGAVQLFRRKCFEAINGYLPLPLGGIDAAAEIMERF